MVSTALTASARAGRARAAVARPPRGRKKASLAGWAFAAPALAVYIAFLVYPALTSLSISFTNWNGISPTRAWVGLANYAHLIHDSVVHTAARNNLIWALVTIIVP